MIIDQKIKIWSFLIKNLINSDQFRSLRSLCTKNRRFAVFEIRTEWSYLRPKVSLTSLLVEVWGEIFRLITLYEKRVHIITQS